MYIIPSDEIFPILDHVVGDSVSRQLHLKRKEGIRERDLEEAFKNYLPDYEDHRFYETLKYWWIIKEFPYTFYS